MRSLVLWWNDSFPLDRAFRKKYNLSFNSEAHRSINQVDVLFEFLEDKMLAEAVEKYKKKKKDGGKMFTDEAETKQEDELFDRFLKNNDGKFL